MNSVYPKTLLLMSVVKLTYCVMLVSASIACAMERESYVTIMIADARPDAPPDVQPDSEPGRGILKREGSRSNKKKVVRWAKTLDSANNMAAKRQAGQQTEQKEQLDQAEFAQQNGEPSTVAWLTEVETLLDTVISERQKSTLQDVGFQEQDFRRAFLKLWPTRSKFHSDGGALDNAQNRESEKQVLFLACLAAHKNKKNDQCMEDINRSRARMKPYGYVKWPFAIMAVCFCEVLIVRAFGCSG